MIINDDIPQAPACELELTRETLSAWRDGALPVGKMDEIARHIPTCAACQAILDEFDLIAQAITTQSVPPAPTPQQAWPQVQSAVVTQHIATKKRQRVVRNVSVATAIVVLAVAVLAGFRAHLGGTTSGVGLYPTTYPGSYPTQGPGQNFDNGTIFDADFAARLTYVYVDSGNLWLTTAGHSAIPLLTSDVYGASLKDSQWGIAWSPDQTRILAIATNNTGGGAWTIVTYNNTITRLPDNSPLQAACGGQIDGTSPCQWLLDRYILYPDRLSATQDVVTYHLYDLQTSQEMPTALDSISIQYQPVIRGPYIFYTEYKDPSIYRYDSVTNSSSFAGSLPGPITNTDGQVAGGWSLANDTRTVFSISGGAEWPGCDKATLNCYAFITSLNGSHHNLSSSPGSAFSSLLVAHFQDQSIAPDGRHIVALVLSVDGAQFIRADVAQTTLYTSNQEIFPIGLRGAGSLSFMGWSQEAWGWAAVTRQVQLDATYHPMSTTIWVEQQHGPPLAAITINKPNVIFAPTDGY